MSSHVWRFEDAAATGVSVAELMHQQVMDAFGEPLGWIEDLVLDAQAGVVAYAVVVVDSRRFALPWHVVRVLPEGGGVVAEVSRAALARSPGMAEPRGPDGPVVVETETVGSGGWPWTAADSAGRRQLSW